MKENKAEFWENKGFILLHRKSLNNPALHSNPNRWSVWTHLLLYATHSEMKKEFDGQTIILNSGQLLTGREFLAKECGISHSTVDRILKWLEKEHQIEQRITNVNRLITILNWSKYQLGGQVKEQRVGNDRATSGQRVGTYNNVENENNEKKVEVLRENPPPSTIIKNQLRTEQESNGYEVEEPILVFETAKVASPLTVINIKPAAPTPPATYIIPKKPSVMTVEPLKVETTTQVASKFKSPYLNQPIKDK